MALIDKELQEFIDSLSTEELEQLQTQLKAKESSNSPRVQPQAGKSKLSCCPHCGSLSFNRHGKTTGSVFCMSDNRKENLFLKGVMHDSGGLP